MKPNLLKQIIRSNCEKNDIPISDISKVIGLSASQTRKILRDETIRYEDLRAISRFLKFSDEDKIKLL